MKKGEELQLIKITIKNIKLNCVLEEIIFFLNQEVEHN